METQKYMGHNMLIDRLSAQVGSREEAIRILRKRGHMELELETLTPAGIARDNMNAEERAKERASRASKRPTRQYTYDPKTNRAVLRRF
jgi:hypothetical protein